MVAPFWVLGFMVCFVGLLFDDLDVSDFLRIGFRFALFLLCLC